MVSIIQIAQSIKQVLKTLSQDIHLNIESPFISLILATHSKHHHPKGSFRTRLHQIIMQIPTQGQVQLR